MVTARTPEKDNIIFKEYYDEMIDRFGSSFTATRETVTIDSLGNVTGTTATTSTVYGDLQIISDKRELNKLGVEGVGAGKFYCKSTSNLNERDTLSINSVLWLVKERIEDDLFGNIESGETWLVIRLDG